MKIKYPYTKPQSLTPFNSNSHPSHFCTKLVSKTYGTSGFIWKGFISFCMPNMKSISYGLKYMVKVKDFPQTDYITPRETNQKLDAHEFYCEGIKKEWYLHLKIVCPRSGIWEHLRLFLGMSVCLWKKILTLAITFEWFEIEISYLAC